MKISSLLSQLWQGNRPAPPTVSQILVIRRIERHLVVHGEIDAMIAQKMGTTDARKLFTRLRRSGFPIRLITQRRSTSCQTTVATANTVSTAGRAASRQAG